MGFLALCRSDSLTHADRAYLQSLLRSPRARLYGAQRFDDGSHDDVAPTFAPHWRPFGGFVFVLPAVELVVNNEGCPVLAVNMLRRDDAPLLLSVLQQIVATPVALNAPAALALPLAHDVQNIVSYESWSNSMTEILQQLDANAYDKIVLARAKRFLFADGTKHDALRVLAGLDEANAHRGGEGAYLFCLQLQDDVAFLGCSPERLFHVRGDAVHTTAVAGTVRCEEEAGLWSAKNVREHEIVVQHISEQLDRLGARVCVGETKVLPLPRLMHVATPIEGRLASDGGPQRFFQLLECMHPTPAVCGMPREKTRRELARLEPFDRGLFAGPFGWIARDEAEFCVAIRSALVHGADITAFAGSGIVCGSECRSEWDETELKMSAFTDLLTGEVSHRGGREVPNGKPNGVESSELNTFDPSRMRDEPNLNALWGAAVADELCRCGVATFFVAPGSRSAPLAVGALRAARGRVISVHDERGAAFMAVGYARATGRAAAVITSSGTAVANLLPAAVEAAMDNLPLVLLTADRPPELRDVGANQTIVQVGIFGEYTKWAADMPCPTADIPLRRILSDVDHAVFMSGSGKDGVESGPVHLNFMFRENLAPDVQPWDRACLNGVGESWTRSIRPLTVCEGFATSVGNCEAFECLDLAREGVIFVGGGPGAPSSEEDRAYVCLLANMLRWPVIASVGSGMRIADDGCENLVCYADQILATDVAHTLFFGKNVVVQFGERIVSKRFLKLMKRCARNDGFQHVVVTPRRTRCDAMLTATYRVVSTPMAFVSRWYELRGTDYGTFLNETYSSVKSKSLGRLLETSRRIESYLDERMDAERDNPVREPWLARALVDALPKDTGLYLGNSMPIRDVDMYGGTRNGLRIAANRGASGIDGIVSSGIGYAMSGMPTCILLGDMSFLHDMNALHVLRFLRHPVTVVVVNNGGGAIFAMLPIAKHRGVAPAFETPHDRCFEGLAWMFGVKYRRVGTVRELETVLREEGREHRLVEVKVECSHEENARLHETIREEISQLVQRSGVVIANGTTHGPT